MVNEVKVGKRCAPQELILQASSGFFINIVGLFWGNGYIGIIKGWKFRNRWGNSGEWGHDSWSL